MGEFISDNNDVMKAYTRFDFQLDVKGIYKEARDKVEEKISDLKGNYGTANNATCATVPEAEEKTYHEKLKDSLLDSYLIDVKNHDKKIFAALDKFKKWIDE